MPEEVNRQDYIISTYNLEPSITSFLVGEKEMLGGFQLIFKFPNGYGASIINHIGSYGTELAVIVWEDDKYFITYDTPITDDIIGYIESKEELIDLLNAIKNLPHKGE